MELVPRVCLLLPLLLGALAIPSSKQKQVSQVRGGRPTGWSGDRPVRQVSHLRLPPPPSPPSLPSPDPLPHTRPPPADRAARTKRSLSRRTRHLHTPSSSVHSQRERRFRSTHRGTSPQTRSLRRTRTRLTADRRSRNNRGLKRARRKKKLISATRPSLAGDAARASYVISDITDTDEQRRLKEAPYLSPPFIRLNDQGQAFRHYSDFDHRPGEGGGITKAGSPFNQAALKSRASRQTGIIDSDTILKDGQIFHRHDAREERNEISRGQSRRRHARPGDQQLLFDEAPHQDVGQRGVTEPGRFFTAEALNSGGQSQTRVSGNMHGVDGSAVTLSGGKVTQAAVMLGENSSSTAHIMDHHGADDPILASAVDAGQRGGAADARARAPDSATTHAQIEFSPADYDEAELGEHGTASALLTPNGESTLASLGGQASRGSYLGTAHSSTLQAQPYFAHNNQVQPSFDNAHVQPTFDNAQVQPFFESEATQMLDGGNKSHGPMDMSDMVSNIMETVHQPHVLPEVAALPVATPHLTPPGTKLIAARKGMVGGSGVPPQESEIGRVSQQLYQEQEGDGRQVAPPAAGQVGIATYFQGELGAPPNGSDLTGPPSEEYTYDPSMYFDLNYPTDYQSPYLDLDPKIFSVEPLELDLDTLYPTPAPPLHRPQPDLTSHSPIVVHQLQTTTPDLLPHASLPVEPSQEPPGTADHPQAPGQPYIPDYSHTIDQQHIPGYFQTPDQPHTSDYPQIPDHPLTLEQPHIPDHSQTPDSFHAPGQPHTPDQSQVPDSFERPVQSPIPGQPYTSDPLPAHVIPDYFQTPDHIPDYSQTPDHIPDYSQTPDHIPDYSQTPDHIPDDSQSPDQPHIPYYSHTPDQPHIPDYSQTPGQSHIPDQPQTSDYHIPHQPSVPSSLPGLQQHHTPGSSHTPDHIPAQPPIPDQASSQNTNQSQSPRPSDTRVSAAAAGDRGSAWSVEATPMPMGVPLVPGQPGSTQMLPNDDGPFLNVITMPANQRMDMSMMHQHARTPIQPGEKIPGAPGYRVPAGFRGHVILGHSLPVGASSQHVMEGFNTQVQITPQSPASDTVFASVSSPQASQQLTSEGGVPGVHVTLGGGGERRQQYQAPAPHLSMASTGGHTGRDRATSIQRNPWYSTDSRQWATSPTARHERPPHRDQSGATRENGWQNGRGRPAVTSTTGSWNRGHTSLPSKSWNGRQSSPQQRGRQCAYITITCRVVINDLGNRRQCQPSYTTRDCCC